MTAPTGIMAEQQGSKFIMLKWNSQPNAKYYFVRITSRYDLTLDKKMH